jgi:hypothetical protein
MSAHCLQLIDGKFAADQYRRAKQELGRNMLGLKDVIRNSRPTRPA